MAHNGDIELHWIDEGPADGPVAVLVNGAGSTAVMWCRALIDPLIVAGMRVIRFDNRDVGRSTRVGLAVEYTVADIAADLAAVLDHLDIDAAHLLGRSMGGMTVLAFAQSRPERVRSLTLVYTSPCLGEPHLHGLPGPKRSALEAMAEAAGAPPPETDEDRIAARVAETRLFAGSRYPFDAAWAHAEAAADVAHASHAQPAHGLAVMRSPAVVDGLGDLGCPTLVIHGTEDPIIDVAHGRFLAARIPGARLVELEGLSHEMPPAMCDEIIHDVLAIMA
jgi:pimeloyl-ACP methyl ester carboxylesterase